MTVFDTTVINDISNQNNETSKENDNLFNDYTKDISKMTEKDSTTNNDNLNNSLIILKILTIVF